MNNHDAVKKLAQACKLIRSAREFCLTQGVDNINLADSIIVDVGDNYFGSQFQKELTSVYEDA